MYPNVKLNHTSNADVPYFEPQKLKCKKGFFKALHGFLDDFDHDLTSRRRWNDGNGSGGTTHK